MHNFRFVFIFGYFYCICLGSWNEAMEKFWSWNCSWWVYNNLSSLLHKL